MFGFRFGLFSLAGLVQARDPDLVNISGANGVASTLRQPRSTGVRGVQRGPTASTVILCTY